MPIKRLGIKTAKLKKPFYNIIASATDMLITSNSETCRIACHINETGNCCGIDEIGDFWWDDNRKTDNIITHDVIIKGIVMMLRNMAKAYRDKNGGRRVGYFSLIDNTEGILILEALKEVKEFTLIKKFINSGSGNIVYVYMSA
jgi:hypothetical protein